MKIHCLIENTCTTAGLTAEHGLSLLIETGAQRILFDTGASAAFAENAARLGVDLSTVDLAVLSHGHYDHGGGLERFMELNTHSPIWVSPHAFEPHFNARGKDIGLNPALQAHPRLRPAIASLAPGITLHTGEDIPVEASGMTAICDGFCQPEDFRHEQYLLIQEGSKRILFSGCSHRGIRNIAAHFRADVLVGGFHLMNETSPARLRQLAAQLLKLPTTYYTGHCTGDFALATMQPLMGNRLQNFSTGTRLEI